MTSGKFDWKINEKLAVGKGATTQEFFATVGSNKLQIDVAPWGEGHLKINGRDAILEVSSAYLPARVGSCNTSQLAVDSHGK